MSGLMNVLNHLTSSPNQGGLQLQTSDLENAGRMAVLGGLFLGVYHLGVSLMRRSLHPEVELEDRQDALHLDTIIYQVFLKLQVYKAQCPIYYLLALRNVDKILLLDDVLARKEQTRVYPTPEDKVVAWTYFKTAVQNLKYFQLEIQNTLGIQHAVAVNDLINRIYTQLQKHLINILKMCNQFDVNDMVKQAQHAIEEARHKAELKATRAETL